MRGDGDRLKQIIWNLLLNAIKFTHKGGQIHVSLLRVDSDLELVFADNGAGIASEVLPYIFETFRQSDSRTTRVHGGLGIGLSITKHLVDLHGGSVEAHSEGLGKGASFSPTDLVATALATCMLTTMGIVAKRHGWVLDGATCTVEKHMVADPERRIGRLPVTIRVPREFGEKEVAPQAERIHRNDDLVPEAFIREMSELGYFGLAIPEEYGGSEMGNLAMILTTEEL